ncbi:MAG: globin family protein [Bacteroidia bacterium]
MTTGEIKIIKETWAMVVPSAGEVGPLFYNRLFEIAPETKHMFTRTNIPEQSKKLLAMLSYVISKLDNLENLLEEIAALAKRHVQYGVKEEHYTKVGEALLWTLEKGLGAVWTAEVKDAWVTCYSTLSGAMIQLSAESKAA